MHHLPGSHYEILGKAFTLELAAVANSPDRTHRSGSFSRPFRVFCRARALDSFSLLKELPDTGGISLEAPYEARGVLKVVVFFLCVGSGEASLRVDRDNPEVPSLGY